MGDESGSVDQPSIDLASLSVNNKPEAGVVDSPKEYTPVVIWTVSEFRTYCARDCHYCMVGYGHAKYMLEEGVKNGVFTDLGNGKYARILVPPGPRGLQKGSRMRGMGGGFCY